VRNGGWPMGCECASARVLCLLLPTMGECQRFIWRLIEAAQAPLYDADPSANATCPFSGKPTRTKAVSRLCASSKERQPRCKLMNGVMRWCLRVQAHLQRRASAPVAVVSS
jgi:hypothetical protein